MTDERKLPRPLFGIRPNSYFGDKTVFCQMLADTLRRLEVKGFENVTDPELAIKNVRKDQILQEAFDAKITLDELVPLSTVLAEEEVRDLLEKSKKEESSTFAMGGEFPPDSVVARSLLQFRALDEICAPTPQWTPEKKELMSRIREKYKDFFQR